MTFATRPSDAAAPVQGLSGPDNSPPPDAVQSWQDALAEPAARAQIADAGGDWGRFLPAPAMEAAPGAEAAGGAGFLARLLPWAGPAAAVGAGLAATQFDAARESGEVQDALRKFGLDPASATDVLAARAYVWGRNIAPRTFWDVPLNGPGNEAVAQALMRNELANPGMLGRADQGDAEAKAGVADVVADALQPDAGGAGGKLPPGPPGRVREDGECDENGSVGIASPLVRLPSTNGAWQGAVGNSAWQSTNPAVNAVTGGRPIPFVNGRPDFTQWSKMSINLEPGVLTGIQTADTALAARALMASNPRMFPSVQSVKDWLSANNLTPHHANDTCLQLIPKALNNLVPHVGGAADIRLQRRSP